MCPDREFDRLHRATRLRCGQHTTMLGSIGLPAELGHRRLRCMHVPDVPSFVNAITTLQRGTIPLMKVRRLSPPLRRTVEPQESWREDGSTPWLRYDPSTWISQSACVPIRGEAGSRLNRKGPPARPWKCQRAGAPPCSRSPGSWVPTFRDPAGSFVPTHHSSLMNRLTDTTVSRVLYLASMYPMYPASSMLLPHYRGGPYP